MENTATVDSASLEVPDNVKSNAPAASKHTPKWIVIGIPVLAVALLAYGYHAGYLLQASSKVTSFVTSLTQAKETAPAVDKPASDSAKIIVARDAFAAGNMQSAIDSYLSQIASNPEDIGARGELGNVYYTIGAFPEAAQTFFDAANLAIEKNQLDVAEALLPAISEGNPMLANQLNDKLFDAQNKVFDEQVRKDDEQMRKELMPTVGQGAPQQHSAAQAQ